jgi:methylglutaconyl-CoA hydratase
MAYRTLHIEHGGGSLATVWLDRPGHRNAINALMLDELSAAFAGFADAPHLRAVVLAARGPAFCAGIEREYAENMDIAGAAASTMATAEETALGNVLQAIQACHVPVVARVQGDCLGAGMALAACCDIVVAAGQASFCSNEPGVPAQIIMPWLAKAMPSRAARRYLLTAERFSAFEAKQLGFVHELAAAEALDERTNAIAGALLQQDTQTLAERRRLLRQLDKEV